MLEFEVKSRVQPVGERKGQTVLYILARQIAEITPSKPML